jgi:uncharacterized protein (DUF885 family)
MSPETPPASELDALEREIVDHVFVQMPGTAVALGLHQYDGIIPDLSSTATAHWAGQTDRLLARLAALDRSHLSADRKLDTFLLRLYLESPLFDIREGRDLDRNPMLFVGAFSLTAYLVREYAPVSDRVRAIVTTLESVPQLLDDGRHRLAGPLPRPFVELALSIGAGLPAHFGEAEAFAEPAGLAREVHTARTVAESALARFMGWLRDEELPRAIPDFALGPERYRRLLFVREGIESTVEDVRAAGAADLARNQARLEEIARDERVAPAALFHRLALDHPVAADVIPTAQAFVEGLREFVVAQGLVTIPGRVQVRVEETPVWGRALSTASMDSPGPFETAAEAVYYVTPVDPKWTPVQQEEWLRSLNRTMLRNITVHEVFPGHYLQFLHWRSSEGSLARRVFMSASFVEGWAHYTEQLAIEAGLGAPRHEAEVAQIHDALLRDCRLLSSIGLHTAGWSLEKATELFQRAAYYDRLPAEREAIRGTFNPEYFCYTLGKLAILTARANTLATVFGGNLKRFHDTLLRFGSPPIGLLPTLLATASSP